MPILSIPEWRPDIADYQGQSTQTVLNVVPRGDGYGPFRDLTSYSIALASSCRGAFFAIKTDSSIAIFAATATKIYKLDNTTLTWTDVSAGAGSYTALSSTDHWAFRQFGNYVVAVQANIAPQVFDLTSSTEFAILAGSPPQARYVEVVGRFLVLSGLLSNPYRVQWSGLNDITNWTSGVGSSDYQDLPDGGIVRAVAGGESGIIFQDRSIRRMIYAPGSPLIFQIERISEDSGLFAPYCVVRASERVFFFAAHGLHVITPGGFPQAIGKERIDRTFFDDVNTSQLQMMIGAADPKNTRVLWAYNSVDGISGQFNKILCYDYGIDRFSIIEKTGEYLLSISQPGTTLEGLDAISSSLDALTASLDSFPGGAIPDLAAFNSEHKLGFFTGDNLEATVVTSEQGTDGKRIFVRGGRPITDANSVYLSASYRENLIDNVTYTSESAINTQGFCPLRISTRYSHGKIRIPAATTWTYVNGMEPDVVLEGMR